jgi:hypothetical protein
MTGYEVAKVVNQMLAARGLKAIPPQMVYNYMKNNLIPSENGRITPENAERWAERYVAKRYAKANV